MGFVRYGSEGRLGDVKGVYLTSDDITRLTYRFIESVALYMHEVGSQRGDSTVVSIHASGPSCPGYESQLWSFFRKNYFAVLIDRTLLKLIKPIQYWLVAS